MTRPAAVVVGLLFVMAGAVFADRLSAPPAGPEGLRPVPVPDISGAEPIARDAMQRARDNLDSLLAKAGVSAEQLGDAYGRLGAYYHVYGIRTPAEACYANAVAQAPGVFRWHFLFAYLAHQSGRYEEALERFAAARRIDPGYPTIDLFEGEGLLELNRSADAEAVLARAVAHDGLRAAAAFRLGQIALERRDYDAAVRWLSSALEADPDADAVYFPLAQAMRGTGDAEGARAALARRGKRLPRVDDPLVGELESLDQGSRPLYLAGLAAIHQGDHAAGAGHFARGLEQDPANHDARMSYARALYLSGSRDEARTQLERVEAEAPERELATFLLGLMDNAAGDTDAARRRFERVLALNADHSGALYFLGLLDFSAGDYASADEHLTASVRAEPGNVYARVLALVARQRHGTPEASVLAELDAVVAVAQDQWLARYALARLLAASGDEALRDPGRAVEIAGALAAEHPFPPMYEALALAHASAGDGASARTALETARSGYLFSGQFGEMNRIDDQLARLQRGELPAEAWPVADRLLSAPVIDLVRPFTEYPAPRAY